uniref:J domain-containing protein n=1 Tax=Arundo donax TaxID=35708 RepID=A0A0A9CT84_ARUDO
MLTVCEVYCAAEEKMNRHLDQYGILQVEITVDNTVITKQYDKIAFSLHPDKNSLPGAEGALKLVSEAYKILCDRTK